LSDWPIQFWISFSAVRVESHPRKRTVWLSRKANAKEEVMYKKNKLAPFRVSFIAPPFFQYKEEARQ
jgi:hypothetical protein